MTFTSSPSSSCAELVSQSLTTLFHSVSTLKRCLFAFVVMLIIYMCRAASTVVILRIFIMLFLVLMMIEIVEIGRFLIGMYRIMFFK